MLRKVVLALVGVAVLAVSAAAAEVRGTIARVDAAKGTITLKFEVLAGGTPKEDKTFTVPASVPIVDLAGKKVEKRLEDKRVTPGIKATVTTETKGGKEVVTKVRVHTEPE
jgi:hypothetical protein